MTQFSLLHLTWADLSQLGSVLECECYYWGNGEKVNMLYDGSITQNDMIELSLAKFQFSLH